MAIWDPTPFFGPDGYDGTAFTHLDAYNSAYVQDTANGHFRISTNGTSAGCVVITAPRCLLSTAPRPNHAAQFAIAGSDVTLAFGLALRFTDGDPGVFWGGTGYVLFYNGSNQIQVDRVDGAGSHTNLALWSYTPASSDVFRGEIVGTTIEGFVNGVSKGTVTDGTYSTGKVGLWCGGTSFDDGTNMSIDQFTVYVELTSQKLERVNVLRPHPFKPGHIQ